MGGVFSKYIMKLIFCLGILVLFLRREVHNFSDWKTYFRAQNLARVQIVQSQEAHFQ